MYCSSLNFFSFLLDRDFLALLPVCAGGGRYQCVSVRRQNFYSSRTAARLHRDCSHRQKYPWPMYMNIESMSDFQTCTMDNTFCIYWYKFSDYQNHCISIFHWEQDFIYWILKTIEKGFKFHLSSTKPRSKAGCPCKAQCHAVCGGPQLPGLCGPPGQKMGAGHGEGLHHSDRAVR